MMSLRTLGLSKKTIYIDFDGTLVDEKTRLFKLFCNLVNDSNLTFEEYWSLKDGGMNQADVLRTRYGMSEEEITAFHKQWLKQIETAPYLLMDKKKEYADAFLEAAKAKYRLVLWTNRQSIQGVLLELNRWGWESMFDTILISEHLKTKLDLLRDDLPEGKESIVISDTVEDCKAARLVGADSFLLLGRKDTFEYCGDTNGCIGINSLCDLLTLI